MNTESPIINVNNLKMAYGSFVIMENMNFEIPRGRIFIVMGGSGCGKSTLLRHLIGLKEPASGTIFYGKQDLGKATSQEHKDILKKMGVLFQGGALWSTMTLAENIMLPLKEFTDLNVQEQNRVASIKLALVGLRGFEAFYPSEISGGMRKRAGLARAMALDPEILFFDEPSAGLDPLNSRHLDDLILQLRDSLETTIVVVTHELGSIFAIGDDSIFLDTESKTIIATGKPSELAEHSDQEKVRNFLSRGKLERSLS